MSRLKQSRHYSFSTKITPFAKGGRRVGFTRRGDLGE